MTNVGMELIESSPAVRTLQGGDSWIISAGGRLKIQTKKGKGNPMEIIINENVPNGKKWEVSVTLVILETCV